MCQIKLNLLVFTPNARNHKWETGFSAGSEQCFPPRSHTPRFLYTNSPENRFNGWTNERNYSKVNTSRNTNNLKVIKRSNKLCNALFLPVIANLNPRSIYNKVDEFHTFVGEYEIDIVFMSESWERGNLKLSEVIKLDN